MLWLTADLFREVVEGGLSGLESVRCLLAGGDVLSVTHVNRVLEGLGGCQLINGYGPTEGTTFSVCGSQRTSSEPGGSVPIGRPIANTSVYVLDEELEPVPVGVVGELYIAGAGLARGYLNRAGLTAERFIAHPFAQASAGTVGERLYRTGDRVRYRSDGSLEFIGRRDHQVKVRGYRIELGEVESALLSHAGVSQAVVVAREDEPREKRLVGYVVGVRGGEAPQPSVLRAYLKTRLPEYLLPAALVVMESLPLTVNGKVDRRALPAPQERPEVE